MPKYEGNDDFVKGLGNTFGSFGVEGIQKAAKNMGSMFSKKPDAPKQLTKKQQYASAKSMGYDVTPDGRMVKSKGKASDKPKAQGAAKKKAVMKPMKRGMKNAKKK